MQLVTIPTPTTRTEAAQALLAVPMATLMTASMTAMARQMAGQPASRSELVEPFLAKLPLDAVPGVIATAIDGALAVAPELAPRAEALRQAAAGVAALLAEAAADHATGDATQTLERLATPLQDVAAPLFEAALLLDPDVAKQPGA